MWSVKALALAQIVDSTGACATVTSTPQNPTVELAPCASGNASQLFQLSADGHLQSMAFTSGNIQCLDYWGGSGPNVGVYDCHAAFNQEWEFNPDGSISVSSTQSCMSNTNASGPVSVFRTIHGAVKHTTCWKTFYHVSFIKHVNSSCSVQRCIVH